MSLFFVKEELKLLREIINGAALNNKVNEYLNQLININTTLWKIEDNIRDCEKNNKFDKYFIELARSVYINNDKRSKIKLSINNKFGSKIVEVKSYEKY